MLFGGSIKVMRNRIEIIMPVVKHDFMQVIVSVKWLRKFEFITYARAAINYACVEITHCGGISIAKAVGGIVIS